MVFSLSPNYRFADTFKYLISLATEEHIWCGNFDLMAPLLETFYNYYKDDRLDSPLRLLWKRMSGEMQHCIQCVSQHHQAQEMYDKEYEMSSIGPLLEVLRSIDEERVTHHLREINDRLKKQEYDPLRDNVGVVSLMYEVLLLLWPSVSGFCFGFLLIFNVYYLLMTCMKDVNTEFDYASSIAYKKAIFIAGVLIGLLSKLFEYYNHLIGKKMDCL